jgi:predicted acyltransferase (DUF342 family)
MSIWNVDTNQQGSGPGTAHFRQNVLLEKKLYVGTDTIIKGATNITGATTITGSVDMKSTLNADGAATLGSTLDVTGATNITGATTITGAVDMKSTLNADGAATLGSTLDVTGATTITGAVDMKSTLNADGAATLGSTLDVTGDTNITGATTITGAVDMKSTLNADGATTLGSTLDVTGDTTITGTKKLFGNMFNKVDGNMLQGTAAILSIANPNAEQSISVAATTYSVGYSANEQDIPAMASGNVGYEKSYLFGAAQGADDIVALIQPADLNYSPAGSTPFCYEQLKHDREHQFHGLHTVVKQGNFRVDAGDTTLSGNTTITGNVNIPDKFYVDYANNQTNIHGTLDVANATTLNDTLDVTGDTTITGAADMKSTINVDGAATLGSTLDVTGATTITGAADMKSTLNAPNATTLGSTLDVTGATTITGAVDMKSTLNAANATTLGSTLDITGDTTISGNLDVTGEVILGDSSSNTGGKITTDVEKITIDPYAIGDAGTVVIAGNLVVQGATTTVDSNTVAIGDSIMLLNKDETGVPSQNGGIEIERGTSDNVKFIWHESNSNWSTEGKDLTTGTGDITTNNTTFTGNVIHGSVTTTITEIADRLATLEKYFRVYSDGTIQIGDDNTATVYLPGTQHFGTTNTGTYYNSDYAGATTSKGTAS